MHMQIVYKLDISNHKTVLNENFLITFSTSFNPITYAILPFRQLRGGGGGFLARIQKTRLQLTD